MMKGLLLPLLCCAWAVMSVAQPATSRIVSLSETLELAIANSAKVKKAQLDRQALEIKLKEGRSAFAPKINASLGIDYVPVLPTTFLPSGLYGGGPDGGYVAATLGQPWQLTGTARLDQPSTVKQALGGLRCRPKPWHFTTCSLPWPKKTCCINTVFKPFKPKNCSTP
ncbi:MAG: TolC family protein [Lewinellaceae bacterium]|nr:TolC family protein [Lewinellaceae bacterium]